MKSTLFMLLLLMAVGSLTAQKGSAQRKFLDIQKENEKHFEKDKTGYKQYKRMEHYMLNRLGKKGRITNTTARNIAAFDQMKSAQNLNREVFAPHGSWDFMGPFATEGPKGTQGRVNRFAFHPTNANVVFAATAGGGLWKTEDKGLHWGPLSDGVPVMNTTGVAVDFMNPNILYLLSGDGDYIVASNRSPEFTRTSIGVYKSYDGGAIWGPTGLTFDETDAIATYNMYMSPEDRNTLFVCTASGLFRSTDAAATWDTIRLGQIYELAFKPGNASRIYCVDRNYVYISENSGTSWSDSTLIPDNDGLDGRMLVTTCENDPNLVYVIAAALDTISLNDSLPDHRGLHLSTNSGDDFNLMSTRPNVMAGHSGTEFKDQSWYDFALDCNPIASNELLIGAIGIFKSETSGDTMFAVGAINGEDTYHADIHAIQTNPLDNMTYVGSDGGVSVSTDFGDTYEYRSNFLGITQIYRMATSPFFSDYVLIGSQDNAVQLRDDVETEFQRVVWGDGMESIFHPTVDSLVITSVQNGETHISVDTGHTFTQIMPPNTAGDMAEWINPMAWDANDPNVIYLGFKPIMKSTDMGATFNPTSNDTISGHQILEIGLSNPNRLYAGDCRNCGDSNIRFEMYVSSNAGTSWDAIHGNLNFPGSNIFVSDATINPDNSEEIWITCGRYDANNKVFRSTDIGQSWTNETGSLPNVPINAIEFEDNNGSPSGAVYIATDIGVFYRNDDLGDWVHFSNQLPMVEVTDLDIDYNGGFIRASTYGRGLWESELYSSCLPVVILNPLNQPIGMSFVHQVSNMLFSTALVDGYGSRVVYKASNQVQLTEGFNAKSQKGAYFKAVLGPCGEGGIESISAPDPTDSLTKQQLQLSTKKN